MPRHLKPISRINSATATRSLSGLDVIVYRKRSAIASGELMVITVAVETASHNHRLSLLAEASCSMLLNTSWICDGAGTGPGQHCAALTSASRAGESFMAVLTKGMCAGQSDSQALSSCSAVLAFVVEGIGSARCTAPG